MSIENTSVRLEDLVLGVAVLNHGGPLSIVDFEIGKQGVDPVLLASQELPKGVKSGLNRGFNRFGNLVIWGYFNGVSQRVMNFEYRSRGLLINAEGVKPLEQEYGQWLGNIADATNVLLARLGRVPLLGGEAQDVRDFMESSLRRHLINYRAINAFLWPETAEFEHIDLRTWLPNRKYQVKKERLIMGKGVSLDNSVVAVQVDPNTPTIGVCEPLLHLALERLISNGYHQIEKDTDNSQTVTVIACQTLTGEAEIIVRNTGILTEAQLGTDPQSGLPSLFKLASRRRGFSSGIGLSFAVRAIQKMGGIIEARNVAGGDMPFVDIAVRFPRYLG